MSNDMLWTEAVRDPDHERLTDALDRVTGALSSKFAFVTEATNKPGFHDRLAHVASHIEKVVAAATDGNPALFATVHAAVLTQWESDFDRIVSFRHQASQRRNNRRGFERKQARTAGNRLQWSEGVQTLADSSTRPMWSATQGKVSFQITPHQIHTDMRQTGPWGDMPIVGYTLRGVANGSSVGMMPPAGSLKSVQEAMAAAEEWLANGTGVFFASKTAASLADVQGKSCDARELLRQMSGARMNLGVREVVDTGDGIMCKIGAGAQTYKMIVKLMGSDTYSVEIGRLRKFDWVSAGTWSDIYAEDLPERLIRIFDQVTSQRGGAKDELIDWEKERQRKHPQDGELIDWEYERERMGKPTASKTAVTVTATEWGVAVSTSSSPYSPEATLGVIKTVEDVPNEWGGRGIVVKHPEYDGLKFPTADEAWAFAEKVGLIKQFVRGASKTAASLRPDQVDGLLSGLDADVKARLLPFAEYLTTTYSRGISENLADAIRSAKWSDTKAYELFLSKLDAHLDIENGGANNWFYDSSQGKYTQRLDGTLGSKRNAITYGPGAHFDQRARTIEEAAETARQNISIQKSVVAPEYLSDYTIVEIEPGNYAVYQSSAWTPQSESILPWEKPYGTPVARVGLDGQLTMLGSKRNAAHEYGPTAPGRDAGTRWENVLTDGSGYTVVVLWPGDEVGMASAIVKDYDRAMEWAQMCFDAGAMTVDVKDNAAGKYTKVQRTASARGSRTAASEGWYQSKYGGQWSATKSYGNSFTGYVTWAEGSDEYEWYVYSAGSSYRMGSTPESSGTEDSFAWACAQADHSGEFFARNHESSKRTASLDAIAMVTERQVRQTGMASHGFTLRSGERKAVTLVREGGLVHWAVTDEEGTDEAGAGAESSVRDSLEKAWDLLNTVLDKQPPPTGDVAQQAEQAADAVGEAVETAGGDAPDDTDSTGGTEGDAKPADGDPDGAPAKGAPEKGKNPFAKSDADQKADDYESENGAGVPSPDPAKPGDPADKSAVPPAASEKGDKPASPTDPAGESATAPAPGSVVDTAEDESMGDVLGIDPKSMTAGQRINMTYTLTDGTTGNVEVTFLREDNDIFFFDGPNGEFGLGDREDEWVDSDGNSFAFSEGDAVEEITGDDDPTGGATLDDIDLDAAAGDADPATPAPDGAEGDAEGEEAAEAPEADAAAPAPAEDGKDTKPDFIKDKAEGESDDKPDPKKKESVKQAMLRENPGMDPRMADRLASRAASLAGALAR